MESVISCTQPRRRAGQWHPRAKLTDHEVELLRSLREADSALWTFSRLAEKFEITKRYAKHLCDYTYR